MKVLDAVGNVTRSIDPLNRATTYGYDALNRRIRVTDPMGHETTSVYDAGGNLKRTVDPLGNSTSHTYDQLNRLTATVDPLLSATRYSYDAAGRLATFTDSKNNVMTYAYDAVGRVISDVNALGDPQTFGYDKVGNLISETDRTGRSITRTYDAMDRMIREDWSGADSHIIAYQFDALGRITLGSDNNSRYQFSYDAASRLVSVDNHGTLNAPNVVFDFQYDKTGNRTKTAETIDGLSGSETLYSHDELNRVTRINQRVGGIEKLVEYRYDLSGQVLGVRRSVGLGDAVITTAYTYDAGGRPTSLQHGTGNSSFARYDLDYDASDRIVAIASADGNRQFTYDAAGQLLTAVDPNHAESFAYDGNGNPSGADITIGSNNRILSDSAFKYEYDKNGNLVRKTNKATSQETAYRWDHHNRLTQAIVSNSSGTVVSRSDYSHDVLDRRIAKLVDSDGIGPNAVEVERFVYDGLNRALTFDAAGLLTHRYLFGPAIDEVLSDDSGAEVFWLMSDHLGTIRDVVDKTGVVRNHITYSSFGSVTAQSNSTLLPAFGFTGREWDQETGLYSYRARMYDPVMARFLNEDPIGFSGGDANLYRYVSNNPILFTDPLGLESQDPSFLTDVVGETFADAGKFAAGFVVGAFEGTAKLLAGVAEGLYLAAVEGTDSFAFKEFVTSKIDSARNGVLNFLNACGKDQRAALDRAGKRLGNAVNEFRRNMTDDPFKSGELAGELLGDVLLVGGAAIKGVRAAANGVDLMTDALRGLELAGDLARGGRLGEKAIGDANDIAKGLVGAAGGEAQASAGKVAESLTSASRSERALNSAEDVSAMARKRDLDQASGSQPATPQARDIAAQNASSDGLVDDVFATRREQEVMDVPRQLEDELLARQASRQAEVTRISGNPNADTVIRDVPGFEPTKVSGGLADEVTAVRAGLANEPTKVRGGLADEPTRIGSGALDDSADIRAAFGSADERISQVNRMADEILADLSAPHAPTAPAPVPTPDPLRPLEPGRFKSVDLSQMPQVQTPTLHAALLRDGASPIGGNIEDVRAVQLLRKLDEASAREQLSLVQNATVAIRERHRRLNEGCLAGECNLASAGLKNVLDEQKISAVRRVGNNASEQHFLVTGEIGELHFVADPSFQQFSLPHEGAFKPGVANLVESNPHFGNLHERNFTFFHSAAERDAFLQELSRSLFGKEGGFSVAPGVVSSDEVVQSLAGLRAEVPDLLGGNLRGTDSSDWSSTGQTLLKLSPENVWLMETQQALSLKETAQALWMLALPQNHPMTIRVALADLPTGQLAQGLITGFSIDRLPNDGRIVLDYDADGHGWFIDPTPLEDSEFSVGTNIQTAGRYDLFTVLLHEMGHVLGFADGVAGFDRHVLRGPNGDLSFVGPDFRAVLSPDGEHLSHQVYPADLMTSMLAPGIRKVPSTLDRRILDTVIKATTGSSPATVEMPVSGLKSGPALPSSGLINPSFQISELTNSAFGWDLVGSVAIREGAAVVMEEGRFNSGLRQSFILPDGARGLRFTIQGASFLANGDAPPDAFEVALLACDTLVPMAGIATSLNATDALFNLQNNRQTFFSPKVTVPRATFSGDRISLDAPAVVQIDLAGVPTGTAMTLFLDLLGFGNPGSFVVVDDVTLLFGSTQETQANNDSVGTDEDTPVVIDVLSNDIAGSGAFDPGTLTITVPPSDGTAQVNLITGRVTYIPAPNFHGSNSFRYTVKDDSDVGSNEATVTILVNSVNDNPVATGDRAETTANTLVSIDLANNDSDVDGRVAAESIQIIIQPKHGSVRLSPQDGSVVYTPSPNYFGNDEFTYTIADGEGLRSNAASVTLTVQRVNHAPAAFDDSYLTPKGVPLVIITAQGLLANDVDSDGDVFTASVSDNPIHGRLSLLEDGSFTYVPDADFVGVEERCYYLNEV